MARNTKIQLRRGTSNQWSNTVPAPVLAEGEIGYEIDTGRFKIGKEGGTLWSLLPYAGGSEIVPGTGLSTIFDNTNNRYTIHSIVESSGVGLSVDLIQSPGDGLTSASGTYYKIGLDDRLQALANNNNSGILVGTNESGIIVRSLSEGSNIDITNADGIEGNPAIGLSDDITLNSVDVTGTVGLNVSGNANISGTLTVNTISFQTNTASLTLGDIYSYGSGVFEDGLYVGIGENATSVVLESRNINTENGITGGGSLSGDLTLGLTGQAKDFHDLSTRGFVVRDSSNSITTRGLASGLNINITNPSGLSSNPTISLDPNVTGLSSITVNGSVSGVNIYGTSGIYDENVTVGGTGVSLSGHKHVYTDVTNFCDGVASCVDTVLAASTGIQLNYIAGSPDRLDIALSGQGLALHTFNQDGIIVRTSEGSFSGRTITPSGSNILVGDGNGVSNNPTIGLNPALLVQSLTTSGNVVIEGNLTVNGTTVTTNVDTVTIEDPSITLGKPSGAIAAEDLKDRGVEFVYQTGDAVQITGFFGYDHSASAWTFLNPATNNDGIYSGTAGLLNVGGLYSSGGISGTILTSTVADGTAPLDVTSTTVVTNLNADKLDGQDGSYYLDSANLTGDINIEVLPVASTTASGIALFSSDNFTFATDGIVSIKDNGIILGTETSGQYVKTLTVSGTGLSIGNANNDDGTDHTVGSNATPACVTGAIVARDSNGDFCASQINLSSISGNVSIPHPTGGTIPTPTYGSTSISGIMGVAGAPDTYLFNFVIDGGTP
jgi:hypothetical protein